MTASMVAHARSPWLIPSRDPFRKCIKPPGVFTLRTALKAATSSAFGAIVFPPPGTHYLQHFQYQSDRFDDSVKVYGIAAGKNRFTI
ncbi:hypothetical protein O5699_00600 [Escherichia coli]|nr:hypothetical protein [Escherichia coli]